MDPAPRHALRTRLADIKQEWQRLLQSEPVLSPLGRPDTLVFLMDTTLAQLVSAMEKDPDAAWLERCLPVVGSVHRHCACGLNPLLKYFSTGEVALRAGAGLALGAAIEETIHRFRLLAQHEVQALCSVCNHPAAMDCELHRPPPPA